MGKLRWCRVRLGRAGDDSRVGRGAFRPGRMKIVSLNPSQVFRAMSSAFCGRGKPYGMRGLASLQFRASQLPAEGSRRSPVRPGAPSARTIRHFDDWHAACNIPGVVSTRFAAGSKRTDSRRPSQLPPAFPPTAVPPTAGPPTPPRPPTTPRGRCEFPLAPAASFFTVTHALRVPGYTPTIDPFPSEVEP